MIKPDIISPLEDVINALDIKKRNCRRDKNTVERPLLRDAVYYLERYRILCNVLGEAVKNSLDFREDEE